MARARSEEEREAPSGAREEGGARILFEHTPSPLLLLDPSGRVLSANRAARHVLGRPEIEPEEIELARLHLSELLMEPGEEELRPLFARLLQGGSEERLLVRLRHTPSLRAAERGGAPQELPPEGEGEGERPGDAELSLAGARIEGESRVIAALRDLPASAKLLRQRLEDVRGALRVAHTELRDSAEGFRALVRTTSDAVVIFDFQSRRGIDANIAAVEMFGYPLPELRALRPRDLLADDEEQTFSEITRRVREAGRARHRGRLKKKDGSEIWADISVSVYESDGTRRIACVFRDISESVARRVELERSNQRLRETQAKLLQAERLAAIGQLAAGVAHEINNPAAFVIGNLSVLEERLRGMRVGRDLLDMVSESLGGMDRIRSIARDLRTFARIEKNEIELIDLNEVLDVASSITMPEIRHRAQLHKELGQLPRIAAHRAKIGQVVINLLINAAQAITEGDAEHNHIHIRSWHQDEEVFLEVRDTGMGISEKHLPRLFEPFFTTKPAGQGTGLGLSLCDQIVRQHEGRIEVESGRDGTVFRVCLPRKSQLVARPRRLANTPYSVPRPVARVLVIDDEVLLLRAYRRMLCPPHDVALAEDGEAALKILARDRSFDLIFCDLMMPKVDGPRFYEALRERDPELLPKVVFCSGGTFSGRVREFVAQVEAPVIEKPLTRRQLLKLIDGQLRSPE